jgi:FixJ family two-component response regulator
VRNLEAADLQVRTDELRARYRSLTPRQRQVLAGVVAGCTNKQIALMLRITERTAKTHRSDVMHKMAVTSVAALVRFHDGLAACGERPDSWRDA